MAAYILMINILKNINLLTYKCYGCIVNIVIELTDVLVLWLAQI